MSGRMLLLGAACLSLIAVGGADGSQLPKLRVSDNQRFLVKDDGTAFIWIGDTIWDFQQLTPEQLDEYLDVRTSQGYSANGSAFSVDLSRLGSDRTKISALWFDPREATYQPAGGPYHRVPSQAFDPPGSPAVDNDWVLVLSAAPPD